MDGILYTAIGDRYFDEALASALSSLAHNDVAHAILTDRARPVPDDRIRVETLPPSGNPYGDKILGMIRSPFARTIYLDTDTYVIGEMVGLFSLLERFDIAACMSPGYRGLADPEVPEAFYELNTGLVVWRSTPDTAAFVQDWHDTYVRWCDEPPFEDAGNTTGYADQPAFRRCLWRHQLNLCVVGHEYCYRTTQCAQIAEQVRTIHGRHVDFDRVAAILNRERRARVFPRGTFDGM
jgi:Nucleotide-diphospho-sugar transferase